MHLNEISTLVQTLLNTPRTSSKCLRVRLINAGIETSLWELATLIKTNPDEATLQKELIPFLARHQNSPLSYTCIPREDFTKLCIAIAVWASEHSPETPKPNPLCLLMPSIQIESLRNDYLALVPPTENVAAWLSEIIQTHILSQDGLSLIPIHILTEIPETLGSFKLSLPYVSELSANEDDYYLSKEDYKRLGAHSAYTQAIMDAKTRIDNLDTSKATDLLTQLSQLTHSLKLYSVQGIGTEENAAGGAFEAIINFRDYYQLLNEEAKAQIPNRVKEEIDLLLDISFNPERNKNAVQQMETCIATRRERLDEAIRGNEQLLSQINIDSQQQESLLYQAQQTLIAARTALSDALELHQYNEGTDQKPITLHLIQALDISVIFHSEEDTELLTTLSPREIRELFQSKIIQTEMINYLTHHDLLIEHLFILCNTLTAEQITSFFNGIKESLLAQNTQRLFSIFRNLVNNLVAEKAIAVMHALTSEIKTALSFATVVNKLDAEQKTAFITAMQKDLPKIVHSADDFRRVFNNLNPEQSTVFITAMKNELPKIIKTADELAIAVPWNKQKAILLLTFFRDKLFPSKETKNYCSDLLLSTSHANRHMLYEAIQAALEHNKHNVHTYQAVTEYIQRKLAKDVSNSNFFKQSLSADLKTKLSTAIWFQTVISGGALLTSVDYNYHKDTLYSSKLGKIAEESPEFNMLLAQLKEHPTYKIKCRKNQIAPITEEPSLTKKTFRG